MLIKLRVKGEDKLTTEYRIEYDENGIFVYHVRIEDGPINDNNKIGEEELTRYYSDQRFFECDEGFMVED